MASVLCWVPEFGETRDTAETFEADSVEDAADQFVARVEDSDSEYQQQFTHPGVNVHFEGQDGRVRVFDVCGHYSFDVFAEEVEVGDGERDAE